MTEIRRMHVDHLAFTDQYLRLAIEKKKTTTIREGYFFFNDIDLPLVSETDRVHARLLRVDYSKTFGMLDDTDARLDGFSSLADLRRALKQIYPNIEEGSPVTIVHFVLARTEDDSNAN